MANPRARVVPRALVRSAGRSAEVATPVLLTRGHRDIVRRTARILELEQRAGASDAHARVEIGRILGEIQARLDHGEWLEWLAESVPFSVRSAETFMHLADWAAAQPALFRELAPLGPSKLYILSRLAPPQLDTLLRRKQHRIPGTERRRTMALLTVGELVAVVIALSDTPPVDANVARVLSSFRRRVNGLADAASALAQLRGDVAREEIAALHAELLDVAAQIAKSFSLRAR